MQLKDVLMQLKAKFIICHLKADAAKGRSEMLMQLKDVLVGSMVLLVVRKYVPEAPLPMAKSRCHRSPRALTQYRSHQYAC